MPPVKNVTFLELMLGAEQDVRAHPLWFAVEQGEDIL